MNIRKKGSRTLRSWGCLLLLSVLAACGSVPTTNQTVTSAPQTSVAVVSTTSAPAPTSAPVPTVQPTATVPPTPTTEPTATIVPTPADPNKGIVFGKPIILTSGAFSIAGVRVSNTSQNVKSFTVKATYKNGDTIAATAAGAVNDLLPGQTRAVSLVAQGQIPAKTDTVRIDIDTMLKDEPPPAGGNIASKITFGKPSVTSTAGFTTIDVEVTNKDTASHSFTVQGVYAQGDDLRGIATGAVNDLASGQTKTATLVLQGKPLGTLTLGIETVIQ